MGTNNFEQNTKFTKRRYIFLPALGIFILILAILIACVIYIRSIRQNFENKTEETVLSINKQEVLHTNDILDWNFLILNSIAQSLSEATDFYSNNVLRKLEKETITYSYSNLTAIGTDGFCESINGEVINLNDREYFQETLKGKQTISFFLTSRFSGKKSITFSVPIYTKDGQIKGVLSGIKEEESLHQMFNSKKNNTLINDKQNEISFLIDISGDGAFITEPNYPFTKEQKEYLVGYISKRLQALKNTHNTNNLDFNSNIHGTIKEQFANKNFLSAYTELPRTNWFLLTSLPLETLNYENQKFSIGIIIICSSLILILLVFISLFSIMQIKTKNHLDSLIMKDPITSGGNENWFNTEAKKLISIARPNSYALVLINVDKIKVINDVYGHEKGNMTLRYIYKCICEILESGEIAARVDSDNFYFLMKFHSSSVTRDRLDLLLLNINSFNDNLDKKFTLSIACGICQINDNKPDMFVLKDHAQVALQNSKRTIASSVRIGFFNERDRIRMYQEKLIESRMDYALLNGQFVVYFQPKYDINTDTVAGAEALVRWKDPEKGLIYPSEFVPLFERNGFILNVDLFVFEQVCKSMRVWLDTGIKPIVISINLSRAYLDDPLFLTYFDDIREKYKIPSKFLELEITESMVLENINWLIEIINKIHSLGFSCSLDDFGSGYSSLNVLKNVPVDVLKLDKEFFANTEKDPDRGNTVVASIIDLAKKLNIKTVSEGVEYSPQVEFLRQAQCDMVQGYIYSKPITIQEFEKLAYGKIITNI